MIGLHNTVRLYLKVSLASKTFEFSFRYLMGGNPNIETTERPEIVVLAGPGSLQR